MPTKPVVGHALERRAQRWGPFALVAAMFGVQIHGNSSAESKSIGELSRDMARVEGAVNAWGASVNSKVDDAIARQFRLEGEVKGWGTVMMDHGNALRECRADIAAIKADRTKP